jgi:hypothetical protein
MALYKVVKTTQEGRFLFILLRIGNPHTGIMRKSAYPLIYGRIEKHLHSCPPLVWARSRSSSLLALDFNFGVFGDVFMIIGKMPT